MFFSKYSLLDFFIATCVCLFCFSILNVIFNLLGVWMPLNLVFQRLKIHCVVSENKKTQSDI